MSLRSENKFYVFFRDGLTKKKKEKGKRKGNRSSRVKTAKKMRFPFARQRDKLEAKLARPG